MGGGFHTVHPTALAGIGPMTDDLLIYEYQMDPLAALQRALRQVASGP